jgi:hypothetical protein
MSQKNEWPAVVIVIEIVAPRIADIIVLDAATQTAPTCASGKTGPKAGQRDLPIHRRVGPAFRREASELLANDV